MNPRDHLRARIATYRSAKARTLLHDARELYRTRWLLLDTVLPGHILDAGAVSALRRLCVLETAHRGWWGPSTGSRRWPPPLRSRCSGSSGRAG